jgi:hypothetical protein
MVDKAHGHECYQNKVPVQFGNWKQTLNLLSHLKALLCVVICLPLFFISNYQKFTHYVRKKNQALMKCKNSPRKVRRPPMWRIIMDLNSHPLGTLGNLWQVIM